MKEGRPTAQEAGAQLEDEEEGDCGREGAAQEQVRTAAGEEGGRGEAGKDGRGPSQRGDERAWRGPGRGADQGPERGALGARRAGQQAQAARRPGRARVARRLEEQGARNEGEGGQGRAQGPAGVEGRAGRSDQAGGGQGGVDAAQVGDDVGRAVCFLCV